MRDSVKDIFKDYSLKQFNKDISGLIKGEVVNHIKLFAATDEAKISVVLRPLGDKTFYYGLHPSFSEQQMLNTVLYKNITTANDFWQAVSKEQSNNNWFKLNGFNNFDNSFDLEQNELETILLGRSILQMASHFGFRLHCKETIVEELKQTIAKLWREESPKSEFNSHTEYFTKEKTFFCQWNANENGTYIDFLGVWPKKIIEKLDKKFEIRFSDNGESIELFIEEKTGVNPISDNYITLSEMYGMMDNPNNLTLRNEFRLRDGNIYYSGTMPRVKKIEYDTNHPSSEQIKYLIMHVERTTFATVDCMDNPIIMLHPFFSKLFKERPLYDYLLDFDRYEDKTQSAYLYNQKEENDDVQTEYETGEIKKINAYLEKSFNTHTVAVSANIETSDHYLLVGKRGKGTIDDGEYYCSVNGQSEFNDEKVSFYQDSVYEDLPTLDFNSNKRIDLNNEIQRETIAELGISMFEQDWQYYGISYLSINNENNYVPSGEKTYEDTAKITKRRMHFNVLTYNKSYSNFENIYNDHENVTEKFENSFIEGIRLNVYKDWKEFMQHFIEKISTRAYNHSGMISVLILSITILMNLLSEKGDKATTSIGILDFFEIFIVTIYLLLVFKKWYSNKEVRQHRRTIRFDTKEFKRHAHSKNNSLSKLFDKFNFNRDLGNKNEKDFQVHVILKVMFALHFLQKKSKTA